jgi:transposase InsO family protein
MIGLWTVKTPKGNSELEALTVIDPATEWFKCKKSADPLHTTPQQPWTTPGLAGALLPKVLGMTEVAKSKKNYGLTEKVGTAYNPQSNGIIEQVHQMIADTLRTLELEKRELDGKDPWTPFLQAVCFAVRSTYHTMLGATPAQLVFRRAKILPIKFKANWTEIEQRRLQEVQ